MASKKPYVEMTREELIAELNARDMKSPPPKYALNETVYVLTYSWTNAAQVANATAVDVREIVKSRTRGTVYRCTPHNNPDAWRSEYTEDILYSTSEEALEVGNTHIALEAQKARKNKAYSKFQKAFEDQTSLKAIVENTEEAVWLEEWISSLLQTYPETLSGMAKTLASNMASAKKTWEKQQYNRDFYLFQSVQYIHSVLLNMQQYIHGLNLAFAECHVVCPQINIPMEYYDAIVAVNNYLDELKLA